MTGVNILTACHHRKQWRQLYLQSVDGDEQEYLCAAQMWTVQCALCQRYFRTEGGKAHHKCIAEQQLPVEEQSGAVQYQRCECCFRSRGRLAVNKCETSEHSTQASFPPEQSFLCNYCGRSFRRPGDLKRHKCLP